MDRSVCAWRLAQGVLEKTASRAGAGSAGKAGTKDIYVTKYIYENIVIFVCCLPLKVEHWTGRGHGHVLDTTITL